MKEKTLVVMAAGMGSRFGGPKQITPIGPNGELIIDYSVYDAILAGFTKVIFIIKEEFKDIFDEKITKNLKNKIDVEYVYQDISMIPSDVTLPIERSKPWGTTHAILCAKDKINSDFLVINADDFYGRDAYFKASEFLNNSDDDNEISVIAYPFYITASNFGSVKRAILKIKDDYVIDLTESKIELKDNKAICNPLNSNEYFEINKDVPVSMNMFCFKKSFLNLIEDDFSEFIHKDKEFILTNESLIPDTIKKYLLLNEIKLKNIVTNGIWAGVTYKDDLPMLQDTIKNLINKNVYSENLWENNEQF